MGDMNNKQNLANCPNAFKVTLDKPCEICGRIRMIRSDIGICIPCIQKKNQNRGWQTGSVWYNTTMTNNNTRNGNDMIHDDFETQIHPEEINECLVYEEMNEAEIKQQREIDTICWFDFDWKL